MRFAHFMATPLGRGLRIVVGVILMMLGLIGIGGWRGLVLALVGAVPLCAGLLNVCLLAPLIGAPFQGIEAATKNS